MTNHEFGINPPRDDDPIAHLNFEMPDEIIDDEDRTWVPISFDTEKDKLVNGLFGHMDMLAELFPPEVLDDPTKFAIYWRRLETFMAKDEAAIDINEGDLLQFKGLKYIAHDGEAYLIPDGLTIRGKYHGLVLYPYYTASETEMVEMLPLGANFAVTDLRVIGEDDQETEYELPEGSHVLLTLHGLDVKVHKLEPVIAA